MATNNAYRKRFLTLTGAAVTSSEVNILNETDSDAAPGPYGWLHLVARSDQAVTIRIYWGLASGAYESMTQIDVPANSADGGGADEVIRIKSRYFKVTAQRVTNDSAAFRCGIDLSAY